MNKELHWFEGERGESVFSIPFLSITEIHESNLELPDFFKKIEESGDERSYVIISALVVENQLDGFLEIIMPGYSKLTEIKDFTFSLKIELLKAHKIIPPIIARCINYIRKIRNEFAHNLSINDIDSVDEKILRVGDSLYDDVYRFYKETHTGKTKRERYHGILQGAIIGLRSYRPNIKLLRRLLDDDEFKLWMKQIGDNEFKQEMKLLKK
jgi:hypothetical protein